MSGRRAGLADQSQQTGVSFVGIQETRCREQVTGSCRGFVVFAAAAVKAGQGSVELWIQQDVMGDRKSFHVLVAEPRLLLINRTGRHHGWARQNAQRSRDTCVVAALRGAHTERVSTDRSRAEVYFEDASDFDCSHTVRDGRS